MAVIQKRYMAHIRFAALAGCGVVGTETGAPNTEYRFVLECHSEEAFDPVNLLHIYNYENRNELVWTAAGQGIMEYEEILSFIKHNKPWIPCTLEDTVPENAVKAAEYIRGIYHKV